MARRQLIFVPGLGDRGRLFGLFRPLWTLFGYDVHIVVFGWERAGMSFATARGRFLERIDALSGEVHIIGVSAGGTAAVHALLERPSVVARVVTVCTPYTLPRGQESNELLIQSVRELEPRFARMTNDLKRRVLSVYGAHDRRVSAALSQPHGVRAVRLPTAGHGLSIALALTIFSWPIWQFLRSPAD